MDRVNDAPFASPAELDQYHGNRRPLASQRSNTASTDPETYREPYVDAFACVVEYFGHDAAHVQVMGELDIATAAKLVQAIEAALSKARLVVVDLSRLTFIDCVGLGAIVAVHNRARRSQRKLFLSSVTAQVNRLMDITGTSARFEVASVYGNALLRPIGAPSTSSGIPNASTSTPA
jgi:anti-anti-sigma factor